MSKKIVPTDNENDPQILQGSKQEKHIGRNIQIWNAFSTTLAPRKDNIVGDLLLLCFN
jgi:hypothetical protein